jgi:mannose-1-phosphate guanylyltransferase/phosphomannomutase
MTIGALVLAGGEGARMRSSRAKPLIEIRGASLLERNVCSLIGAGLRAIWIACRHDQPAIQCDVDRLAAAARQRGVELRTIVETAALGTIGAAGMLRALPALVTVNADNLTALDLAAVIAQHARTAADLTLATHDHTMRLPYGAIEVDRERVTGYREKPAWVTRVASAVCVLGPAALAAIDGRCDLPALTQRLIADGARVLAYHHAAPWIDVNEPDDVARAAALIAAHPDRLDCWARPADLEVAGAIVRDGDHVLLEHRRDVRLWDTPGGKLEPGEPAEVAIVRELREELGVEVVAGPERARFDMLDASGHAIRHHVFAPSVRRTEVIAREGQTLDWFLLRQLPADRSPVVGRSLAAALEQG